MTETVSGQAVAAAHSITLRNGACPTGSRHTITTDDDVADPRWPAHHLTGQSVRVNKTAEDDAVDADADVTRLSRGEVAGAVQTTALPIPTTTAAHLPLQQLDPGVFERLVTEIVTRRDNRGAFFYGRSGQKQWGLDIVENRNDGANEVFQVRRMASLTPAGIRGAVDDYAGPPRSDDNPNPARRFNARAFTIVTTAEFQTDTNNADELEALRETYRGDLDLDIWGAEQVETVLRHEPYIVAAYFGTSWAQVWCGAEVHLPAPAAPAALAFVESPYEVLGLTTLRAEASALETTDPARSSELFRSLAGELQRNGFPGHAATITRRRAKCLHAAGNEQDAFEILTALVTAELLSRSADTFSIARRELADAAAALGPVQVARCDAIDAIASWHEDMCDLAAVVPALKTMADNGDPLAGTLICLALEQAVVDGWYDHSTAESPFTRGLVDPDTHLQDLRALAATADPPDPTMRGRLRAAIADASLAWDSTPEQVSAAYAEALGDSSSGRFLTARGLVTSRAAFAHATRGDFTRAEQLWRQTAIYASEDGYHGDVRHALRSNQRLAHDQGLPAGSTLEILQALPNRSRILAGSYDPALIAFEHAHNGKVRDAFGDGRRYLWESRIGGHWQEWLLATRLLGDVFVEAGHFTNAILLLVAAGHAEEAAAAAKQVPEYLDTLRWVDASTPRVQAAAIRALRVQIPLLPEALDDQVQATLSAITPSIWTELWNPHPAREAIAALTTFRHRLRPTVVDAVIELVEPARTQPTRISDQLASVLMQLYGAVPERRGDIAAVIADLLSLESPPHNLWDTIETVPEDMRTELTAVIEPLAQTGRPPALKTLAAWGTANVNAQYLARLACASLLRNPVGTERESLRVTSQADATVDLLTYLASLEDHDDIPAEKLAPSTTYMAGGVIMQVQYGPSAPPPTEAGPQPVPAPTPVPGPSAEEIEALKVPDEAARIAAGDVGALVSAVALHLAAVAEDVLDYGPERVNAVAALHQLTAHLDVATAAGIGARMFDLHRNPVLGEIDHFNAAMSSPLGRSRFNLGGDRLGPYALMVAASCYRRVHELDPRLIDDPATVEQAIAAATALLASGAGDLHHAGAVTLAALSDVSPAAELAFTLVAHPDGRVRSLGAHKVTPTTTLLEVFARDGVADVRMAAAEHPELLTKPTIAALAADPHSGVRNTLASATAIETTSAAPGSAGTTS